MKVLRVLNRQRTMALDTRLLRAILLHVLRKLRPKDSFQLAIHVVNGEEITALNETFLRHEGPTDVITFDYREYVEGADSGRPPCRSRPAGNESARTDPRGAKRGELTSPVSELHGEVFVCIDEAVRQARRFRTTWQAELVRYAVHGILHLDGHDDLETENRRKMKREENRLVRMLCDYFAFGQLQRNIH
jgi:probable rRNA maturation factor